MLKLFTAFFLFFSLVFANNYHEKASNEFAKKNFKAAEKYYNLAVKKNKSPVAFLGLCRSLLKQNKLKNAQNIAFGVYQKYKNNPTSFVALSEVFFEQKKYELAFDFVEKGMVIDSLNIDLIHVGAKSLLACGKVKQAEKYIFKAVKNSIANNKTGKIIQQISIAQKKQSFFWFGKAEIVSLVGEFNNWDPSKNIFSKIGNLWLCTTSLKPGCYSYKFVINNKNWIADPNNNMIEVDEWEKNNSLLIVKP